MDAKCCSTPHNVQRKDSTKSEISKRSDAMLSRWLVWKAVRWRTTIRHEKGDLICFLFFFVLFCFLFCFVFCFLLCGVDVVLMFGF